MAKQITWNRVGDPTILSIKTLLEFAGLCWISNRRVISYRRLEAERGFRLGACGNSALAIAASVGSIIGGTPGNK